MNDNAEDPATADVGLATEKNASNWVKELDVTPNGDGVATVYLKVTGRYAGDNYQVEVTKCAPAPAKCAAGWLSHRVFALSPIFTAWKRIHIERDKMFRKGGVLAEDFFIQPGTCGGNGQPVCCGSPGALACDEIRVYEWADVAVDDWVIFFDRSIAYASSYAIDYFAPLRIVMAVGAPDADGLRVLTLDSPLSRNFKASVSVQADTPADVRLQPVFYDPNADEFHSSGFGVVSGCDASSNQINGPDSCFFDVDLRGVERTFNDAFVEVIAPRKGMSIGPFLSRSWINWAPSQSPNPMDYFSWIWFEHRSNDAINYRHVIGAGKAGDYDHNEIVLGLTSRVFHRSYVFRGSVEVEGLMKDPPATPQQLNHQTEDTTVHELGHHFHVQACSGGHHDDATNPKPSWCSFPWSDPAVCPSWASSPELCLMNTGQILGDNDQGWDPVMRFCEECLFIGDLTCNPGPNGLRDGAIRTAADPIPLP